MNVEFSAKKGSRMTDSQADMYGKHITNLLNSRQLNSVTAEDVVKDAKENVLAPYRDYFEWDDKVAGHKHRVNQARKLLRSIVKIKVDEQIVEHETRAFHFVDAKVNNVVYKGYTPKEVVFSTEELRQQVVAKALKEVRNWSERYKMYTELSVIHDVIEKVLGKD